MSSHESKVDVNFESHPPIEEDLDGIATLLRQTLLHFLDCNKLARYLIDLKDVTQVIALEASDEQDDEPDNDIYGVTSFIEVSKDNEQLVRFLSEKCPEFKKTYEQSGIKVGLVVNERYINLPPQLSVPTLKNLTKHLEQFTHLVFVSKVLLRSRETETKLPSKKPKTKQSHDDPIIYVNAEEEIIQENCEYQSDIDVSSFCDENATWSQSSDVKYIPHRRIMVIDQKKWPTILKKLEEELAA